MTARNIRQIHDLGPLQREVLNILWEKGSMTVHSVLVALPDPPHYVTVLTVMRRLMQRGLLTGEKVKSGTTTQFLFSPAVDRIAVQDALLRDLIPTLFLDREDVARAAQRWELFS